MFLSSYFMCSGSVPVCCQACSSENRGSGSLCSIEQYGGWIYRCGNARLRFPVSMSCLLHVVNSCVDWVPISAISPCYSHFLHVWWQSLKAEGIRILILVCAWVSCQDEIVAYETKVRLGLSFLCIVELDTCYRITQYHMFIFGGTSVPVLW